MQGTYGPLVPPRAGFLPLWIAITLKKSNKCSIVRPTWMDPEFLQRHYQREKNEETFAPLPFHYQQIATILLEAYTPHVVGRKF